MKKFMTRKLEVKEQFELFTLFSVIGLLIYVLAWRDMTTVANSIFAEVGFWITMSGMMGEVSIARDAFYKWFERN